MAQGCKLCVEGRKLVLFVTGLCPQRCFYCPVSEHKFGHDVVYANETRIKDVKSAKEIIKEARLTGAKGAGITGGDPLVKVERCCQYIIEMKKEFGKDFHFHLYTPLKIVDEEKLRKLYDAGLDEIRFHPDLDDEALWPRLCLAKKFKWDIGIEIPCIPGYEKKVMKLIDFALDKVDFINLNELELSDTKAAHYHLSELDYMQKDPISYGVKGSKDAGMKILEYASRKGLKAYFCTAQLKDSIQVGERIKLRAKGVKLPTDAVTKEGMLIRGCIYLPEHKPSVGYRKMLETLDKEKEVKRLEKIREVIVDKFKAEIVIDIDKIRLLASEKFVKSYSEKLKEMGLVPAIVEEYPTADAFEIEIDFL
jgi:pyruvate formate-lyase activating enzyme-like uncharacterized protein